MIKGSLPDNQWLGNLQIITYYEGHAYNKGPPQRRAGRISRRSLTKQRLTASRPDVLQVMEMTTWRSMIPGVPHRYALKKRGGSSYPFTMHRKWGALSISTNLCLGQELQSLTVTLADSASGNLRLHSCTCQTRGA